MMQKLSQSTSIADVKVNTQPVDKAKKPREKKDKKPKDVTK
jgi:hypothetical protein